MFYCNRCLFLLIRVGVLFHLCSTFFIRRCSTTIMRVRVSCDKGIPGAVSIIFKPMFYLSIRQLSRSSCFVSGYKNIPSRIRCRERIVRCKAVPRCQSKTISIYTTHTDTRKYSYTHENSIPQNCCFRTKQLNKKKTKMKITENSQSRKHMGCVMKSLLIRMRENHRSFIMQYHLNREYREANAIQTILCFQSNHMELVFRLHSTVQIIFQPDDVETSKKVGGLRLYAVRRFYLSVFVDKINTKELYGGVDGYNCITYVVYAKLCNIQFQ